MSGARTGCGGGNHGHWPGRFAIKVPGLLRPRDILDMPLKVSGDAVTRVRDVATLRRTFKDAGSLARIDGLPAIGIEVSKRAGTNIIDTIAEVRRVTGQETASWPEQVKITYSQDVSADIRSMLRDLENNLITAVLLVLIVVVASLGLRGGLIAGIAVPGSFLIGILMLAGFGITINIVVLFSLILATGLLVDGAIILVEYADRCMLNGMPRREAYAVATRKMAWPIFSSIMTIVAAFGPMAFWPGTIGEFMKYLPITLSATLFASLLMAMLFIPCIGALIGAPNGEALSTLEAGSCPWPSNYAAPAGSTGSTSRHCVRRCDTRRRSSCSASPSWPALPMPMSRISMPGSNSFPRSSLTG
jgi:multidrug efflux pump